MVKQLGVVTPVYNTPKNNRSEYFKDTTASVLAQDCDFTWLVVDNGSTDEQTLDFYESIHDPRFNLHRIGRMGDEKTPSRALNYGFNWLYNTNHQTFCYVHSDDLLTQKSLEWRLERISDSEMIYGKVGYFSSGSLSTKQYPPKGRNPSSLDLMNDLFPHHTSMWSRDLFGLMLGQKSGELFDESIVASEDMGVTLISRRVMEKERFNLGFVDEMLYIWINHEGNITNNTPRKELEEVTVQTYREFEFDELVVPRWKLHLTRPGFFLPESVKRGIRPLTKRLNRLFFGKLFPHNYEVSNVNPYWFREQEAKLERNN